MVTTLAIDNENMTATLSATDVAVLLFVLAGARSRFFWIDGMDDEITTADWSEINQLIDNVEASIINAPED